MGSQMQGVALLGHALKFFSPTIFVMWPIAKHAISLLMLERIRNIWLPTKTRELYICFFLELAYLFQNPELIWLVVFHGDLSLSYSYVFPLTHFPFKCEWLKWDHEPFRRDPGFVWNTQRCMQISELGQPGFVLNLCCCFIISPLKGCRVRY